MASLQLGSGESPNSMLVLLCHYPSAERESFIIIAKWRQVQIPHGDSIDSMEAGLIVVQWI